MNKNLLYAFPNIEGEEILFITEATKDLSEEGFKNFVLLYQGRRKDPQIVMICAIIGFAGAAGIQRFLLGQIGMGILYLFTGGLCLIGTIIDLVNYKRLALEYNQKMVIECKHLAATYS